MKRLFTLLLTLAVSAGFGVTHLKVGDKAPDFTLPATTGDNVSLSDYLGRQVVVVGFFPAAFTGG